MPWQGVLMKETTMKTTRKVPTRFEPETKFELKPAASAPLRAAHEDRFESLKNKLLIERIEAAFEPSFQSHLQLAANEAAALAWITPYPLLVFPALFEEKAETACERADRQAAIRERSRELLAI